MQLLKFWNGSVISSRNFLVLLIHSVIKVKSCKYVSARCEGGGGGGLTLRSNGVVGLSKMRRWHVYPMPQPNTLCCAMYWRGTKSKQEYSSQDTPVIAISILNHFFIAISNRSKSICTQFKNSDIYWYNHWKCAPSLTDERCKFCGK